MTCAGGRSRRRAGPRRGLLVAVVAVVLAACTSTLPPTPGSGHPPLTTDLPVAGVLAHAEELQRIADENGRNRASPGPGYDVGVDYVAGVLRDAGFEVTTPSFPFESSDDDETEVRNVIAQTRTGNPGRVVLAGAHLDSVPDGPGINDNASGVATLLEIAVRLGGSAPVTNAVRFAFWGAEEESLNGSTAYVDSLSEPESDAIALYLNVDMVASPNAGYFVQGGVGGRESLAGPPGSATVGRVLAEQLAATGVTPELVGFDGGSDFVPFIEAGIPSGGVLAGDAGTKSAEQAERWGGRAGAPFDPCYHSACDRLDTLDRTALDRFGDALAGTVARFAASTEGVVR